MSLISDLEQRVQDRLEEDHGAGKFWSVQDEIRIFLAEAIAEATLITGDPEIRSGSAYALAANTTLFAMPAGALAMITLEGVGGLPIRKVQLWDLDMKKPTWENDTGTTVKYWFPYGLTQFGIYPKLTAPASVVPTYVGIPIPYILPFTGAESIPFQPEYDEGFMEYAAHAARVKEGSVDMFQSLQEYGRYLDRMAEMSKFAVRKDALRFSRVTGPPAKASPVEEK